MKQHIRILGWIHVGIATVCLVVGALLCIQTADDPPAFQYIGPVYLMACFVLIPELVGGVGLLRGAQWGRVIILILSALFVLLPPGTLLSIYGFWALLKKDAKTAFVSHPWAKPTSGLALAMLGVAAGFFLVIKAGFLIHHQTQPPVIASDGLAIVALAAFCAACFVGLRSLRFPSRTKPPAETEKAFAEWREFVAAYQADVLRTITCVHLSPIEHAMRAAGIAMQPIAQTSASAACRVNVAELTRAFGIAPPIRYAEVYQTERFDDQIPYAYLMCDQCKCTIHTIHPDQAKAGSAWFPGRPNS